MSRKEDLEANIRESYRIIRQYEETLRDSDRPEERARAQRIIREQWELVKGYLPEYQTLARGMLSKDIAEIAVSAQVVTQGNSTKSAVTPPAFLPTGRRTGWALAGAGVLIVAVIVIITVLIETGLGKGKATPTVVVSQSTSTFTAPAPTDTSLPPSPTVSPTVTWTPVPPTPTPTLGIGSTRVWDKDDMVMVYVPAGEFLMGSTDADKDAQDDEKPQHTVYLDAFWIDQTEVTNAQYKECVADGACQASYYADNSIYNSDTQPVVGVSWSNAQTYCTWAGKQLPTEAQWEKAARGTDGRIYPWGNQVATCDYAVMDDGNGNGCGQGSKAWPVSSKPQGASPYGALDMAGNVWEWAADWYDAGYYSNSPAQNPTGPSSGVQRVLRGGSYGGFWSLVRAANRDRYDPSFVSVGVGFRCVRSGSE